ncbi:MAG: 23S rRNA (guanosine(2251)-2'-O)-methyltransferase RlmB [Mycoplasmataceae bacterium]|jgi:23S rRNA (guanosine2251-2'-O)-methyltransferase|nr:23S rRNA (guanosine(2251)-2'-O)-methyltransferase RlmB [Mycoplasmataceae bacterium]
MLRQLFGKKVLLDNLDNPNIVSVNLSIQNQYLITELKKHNIAYKIRNVAFFDHFPSNLNHQGIVINIKDEAKFKTLDTFIEFIDNKSIATVLIIDSIQDPQNFGSILRTCDGMNVSAVIYKKNNQVQINDFVSKVSMGAIQYLNLIKVPNLIQAIEKLKKAGFWTYASLLTTTAVTYTQIKFASKSIIIVGSEEKGISPLLAKQADFQIKIPMYGKVQSLNVAVATGIILSEINRQNN